MTSNSIATVLVTGGSGFIGTAIIERLAESHPECRIYILDLAPPDKTVAAKLRTISKVKFTEDKQPVFVQADITDAQHTREVILDLRPNIIVHAAGYIPPLGERYVATKEQCAKTERINVQGTKNVVEAAQEASVPLPATSKKPPNIETEGHMLTKRTRGLVYISSCTVLTDDLDHDYPNHDENTPVRGPRLLYGETKAVAEAIVFCANCAASDTSTVEESPSLQTCVIRPAPCFGEFDTQVLPSMRALIAQGQTRFVIGDGSNLQDFVYFRNVADAVVLAVDGLVAEVESLGVQQTGKGKVAGEAFYISNCEPVPLRELCLAIWKAYGHVPTSTVRLPYSVAVTGAYVAQGIAWLVSFFRRSRGDAEVIVPVAALKEAVATRYGSCEKARRVLGYAPRVGLEEGIQRSVRITNEAGD